MATHPGSPDPSTAVWKFGLPSEPSSHWVMCSATPTEVAVSIPRFPGSPVPRGLARSARQGGLHGRMSCITEHFIFLQDKEAFPPVLSALPRRRFLPCIFRSETKTPRQGFFIVSCGGGPPIQAFGHGVQSISSPPAVRTFSACDQKRPEQRCGDIGGCNNDGSAGRCDGSGGDSCGRRDSSRHDRDLKFFFSDFLIGYRILAAESVIAFLSRGWRFISLWPVLSCILLGFYLVPIGAPAKAIRHHDYNRDNKDVIWEVKRSKWCKLVPNLKDDTFVVSEPSSPSSLSSYSLPVVTSRLWLCCKDVLMHVFLPEGFPGSVTSDYLDYSLWRAAQGVFSQINAIVATRALLFAVGLGKGAIPTAAAVSWVLKDGIGHLSKILLSKCGRDFDVNPKGWRLFADLLENTAYGMELLTPVFPNLFVLIGAIAGAGRSASTLIQAATRNSFYAGFAARRNFAEVIAKGEAQGMMSKSIGVLLGVVLAKCVGSSNFLAFLCFGVVTSMHMFCNLKSYKSIQLRNLNSYRASLIFSEYLHSGQVPSVEDVNSAEPLFPGISVINMNFSVGKMMLLSEEAKGAAADIHHRLQLGMKLSDFVTKKEDAVALLSLYANENYILLEHNKKYCVMLKEQSYPHDLLKSLFHVSFLYWLERNAGLESRGIPEDCSLGGRLAISLDYVRREFDHVKKDGKLAGWVTDVLVARPSPLRIRTCDVQTH